MRTTKSQASSRTRKSKAGAGPATTAPAKPTWAGDLKLAHPTYVVEPCTNPTCGYPEADGGYCPACGTVRHPYDCPCKGRC